ncbi:hypothetical protein CRUP_028166 [Coryphaenoides rupestris]|nr:hypothetical protein CRUP_028166 [Coryphaenoides rupestris]
MASCSVLRDLLFSWAAGALGEICRGTCTEVLYSRTPRDTEQATVTRDSFGTVWQFVQQVVGSK